MSNADIVQYGDFKDLEYVAPEDTGESKRCTLFDKPTLLEERSEEAPIEKPKVLNTSAVVEGSHLHNMHHEADPKEAILSKIGEIKDEDAVLSGAQVLVATYFHPEKTKGGLYLTAKSREEDKFQGKCGLVIKRGPLAFVETDKIKFGGYEAKVGDWVFYRPMDGYALSVRGNHCRVLDDVEIKGTIGHPDIIV